MIDRIEYKKQGDGRDSWWIYYTEDRVPELVFEDPTIQKGIDMSNVDLSTMTPEQLQALKTALGL